MDNQENTESNEEGSLIRAFKRKLDMAEDVWIIVTSLPDDQDEPLTGQEPYDIVCQLTTTDLQRTRDLMGKAGEHLRNSHDWSGKFFYKSKYEGAPEIDQSVYMYLTDEAKANRPSNATVVSFD